MKKKGLFRWIVLAAAVVVGWTGSNVYHGIKDADRLNAFEALKSQVNVLEAARVQERAQYEADIEIFKKMAIDAGKIINGLEAEKDVLRESIAARDVEISELKTAEVEELIERYPALKRFTLALEAQVAEQKQLVFNLEAKDKERVKVIDAKDGIILNKDLEIESLKKDIEDGKKLLAKCEKDFADYRLKPGPTSIWTKLFWTGVGFGGAKLGQSLKLF